MGSPKASVKTSPHPNQKPTLKSAANDPVASHRMERNPDLKRTVSHWA
jgi:hypothetical protein